MLQSLLGSPAMAENEDRSALHIIRDALTDPTARSVLGTLSVQDLDRVAGLSKQRLHQQLDDILKAPDPVRQAQLSTTEVSAAIRKLSPEQVTALSQLFKQHHLTC
jgi:hypothetical protein